MRRQTKSVENAGKLYVSLISQIDNRTTRTHPRFMVVPQRTSLVHQLVEILRQRLQAGEWKGWLTGEHDLCEQYHVSRPTLRKALAALAEEGWIRAEHGLGWRVLARSRTTAPSVTGKKVGLLCFLPLGEASHFTLFLIERLQVQLHREGCEVEIFAGAQYASPNSRNSLERLVNQSRANRWILLGPTLRVQQWFRSRNIPAFVSLTGHENIGLPSVRVDLRAMYRHAVGKLVGRGLSHLEWVVPNISTSPEENQNQGFWDVVKRYQNAPDFSARMVAHAETVESIHRALRPLLRSFTPSTVLIVVRPNHALAVVTFLSHHGIQIPRDVSVLCIGYEPFLENVTPTLAYYTTNRQTYARKLCRAVLPWVKTGIASATETILFPEFHDGASLGNSQR